MQANATLVTCYFSFSDDRVLRDERRRNNLFSYQHEKQPVKHASQIRTHRKRRIKSTVSLWGVFICHSRCRGKCKCYNMVIITVCSSLHEELELGRQDLQLVVCPLVTPCTVTCSTRAGTESVTGDGSR